MKAKKSSEASQLEDIPNIGPAIAKDLREAGINHPNQLNGKVKSWWTFTSKRKMLFSCGF